ncbi:hypothetical protein OG21DRAFT_1515750 [Imleria badia]|nr:hypothetical protein OG21DRAFT_1515750 [Imleria badia]
MGLGLLFAVDDLEPPSDATLKAKRQNEEKAFQPGAAELATMRADNPTEPPRRRKGAKGPNSLSVKGKGISRARQRISTRTGDIYGRASCRSEKREY